MIYFIRAVGTDRVKIGWTTGDATSRLAALEVGSPYKLCIEGLLPGDHTVERDFHRRLDAKRVHGEWFRLTKKEVRKLLKGGIPAPGAPPNKPDSAEQEIWRELCCHVHHCLRESIPTLPDLQDNLMHPVDALVNHILGGWKPAIKRAAARADWNNYSYETALKEWTAKKAAYDTWLGLPTFARTENTKIVDPDDPYDLWRGNASEEIGM